MRVRALIVTCSAVLLLSFAGSAAAKQQTRVTSDASGSASASKVGPIPDKPRHLVVVKTTLNRVLLDWAAPKGATKGIRFGVLHGRKVVRKSKMTRITLKGFKCGTRYSLSVVSYSPTGRRSKPTKRVKANTLRCAVAASAGGGAGQLPGVRDAALWPFAVSSPWNMPIGSGAQFGGTGDARTASLLSVRSAAIDAGAWSVPTYIAGAGDPLTTVSAPTDTIRIAVPAAAAAATGTDGTMVIVDSTRTYLDEFWRASKTGATSWSVGRHVRNDVRGPGMLQHGIRASGFSAMGGIIRSWEVQSGAIRHALVMAIPSTSAKKGWVWPAISEDDYANSYGGGIPIGTLFAIPSNVDVTKLGLSSDGLVLALALQNYGVYASDTGTVGGATNLAFPAEPSLEGSAKLANMRNALNSLYSQLRPVVNNSANSVGGGGLARQPLAPRF